MLMEMLAVLQWLRPHVCVHVCKLEVWPSLGNSVPR